MRRTILALAATAALCACGQQRTAERQAAGCAAQAETTWAASPTTTLPVSGALAGADCASAEVTLTIKDGAGKTLYTHTMPVAPMTNTLFVDAKTPEDYKKGLEQWIDAESASGAGNTGELPEWKAGQETIGDGEFPFMPDEAMTREKFAALRSQNLPIYCHIQGGESLACIAFDEKADAITKLGLQLFPG